MQKCARFPLSDRSGKGSKEAITRNTRRWKNPNKFASETPIEKQGTFYGPEITRTYQMKEVPRTKTEKKRKRTRREVFFRESASVLEARSNKINAARPFLRTLLPYLGGKGHEVHAKAHEGLLVEAFS